MAGDWFAADCDMPSKPEVHRIATAACVDRQLVVGRFWEWFAWVDRQAKAHPTAKGWGLFAGITAVDIARECGGDAAYWEIVAKFAPEWLRFDPRGACVPGYDARFSQSAKRRLEDAERKRAERKAAKDGSAPADPATPETPAQTPAGKPPRKGFAYAQVTAEMLAHPSRVVEWCAKASTDKTTNIRNEEYWHIALIAAANLSLKAENPAAYFITLVRDKSLKSIPDHLIAKARADYRSLNQLIEGMRSAREAHAARMVIANQDPAPLGAVLPMLKRG